jgi:hypothetical protein
MTRVVDPGTDWFPIRWGPRIRIRNPDTGGQKVSHKNRKYLIHFIF